MLISSIFALLGGRAAKARNFEMPLMGAIFGLVSFGFFIGSIFSLIALALVAIHSFTPVYLGKVRPWQVGILFDDDRRLADLLIEGFKADPDLSVGINQPYSPADGVYYTLGRHAKPGRLPAGMVEIRNDEIADEASQRRWGTRLANFLLAATPGLFESRHIMA